MDACGRGAVKISIVLLTHRETENLACSCLRSLEGAGAPAEAEVLVGYNGAWPDDEPSFERLRALFPWARFVALENAPRGAARNRLVPLAHGEIIHFLDDDTMVPPGFLRRLRRAYERHPGAPALGGPNVGPPGAAPFERAVDFLLRSPFGAGPMRVRYLRRGKPRSRPSWCFMLSNLGARRHVFFEKRIFFPEDCVSAEENLFLHHVASRLGEALFDPRLYVHHKRRTDLASFCRQVACNGMGRAQITRTNAATLQAVVLAPVGAAAAFPLLVAAGRWRALAVLGASYAALCAFEMGRLALAESDPEAALRLAVLFAAAHASYAWGFARGLLQAGQRAPVRLPKTADA